MAENWAEKQIGTRSLAKKRKNAEKTNLEEKTRGNPEVTVVGDANRGRQGVQRFPPKPCFRQFRDPDPGRPY